MNKKVTVAKLMLVGGVLISLSGCAVLDKVREMFSGKQEKPKTIEMVEPQDDEDDSDTIVFLGKDKEPALKVSEFKRHLGQILKMYPQLNGALDIENLPVALKKTFLDKIVDQKLIIKKAKSENYEADAKFQKDLAEAIALLKEHMLLQEYEKRIVGSIKVTDRDIKAEYDSNKSAKYVKSAGGVVTSGVEFSSQEAASEFLASVEGKDFEAFKNAGETSSGTHREFGVISDKTHALAAPESIKSASLKASRFPSVKLVTDGDKTWVVHLAEKKKTEFFNFNEIKGQIENQLKAQMFQESFSNRMESLRKEYPVTVVDSLLESKASNNAKPVVG